MYCILCGYHKIKCGVDSCGSDEGEAVGFCECGDEVLDVIKCGAF
jgi:hypothetical protein